MSQPDLPDIPRPAGIPVPGDDPSTPSVRLEVAAQAARLIADAGLDYASAKRRALDDLLDGRAAPRGLMPDNHEIDRALAEHLDMFDPQHPARVARMRGVALRLMHVLHDCRPYLTGSVWKGIVAEHAPIHIQVFVDDTKTVALRLMDEGIDFDADEIDHFRDGGRKRVEALQLLWCNEPILISLYTHDDLRGALRGTPAERGDQHSVELLLAATPCALRQSEPTQAFFGASR
jgi:hypothetical protein